MENIKLYTLGFAFTEDKKWVLLIRKDKDDWQKGLLNGLGGKLHKGETVNIGMQREFKEESGVLIPADEWGYFGKMENDEWCVYMFRIFTNAINRFIPDKITHECVGVQHKEGNIQAHKVSRIKYEKPISNLNWIIPLALDISLSEYIVTGQINTE